MPRKLPPHVESWRDRHGKLRVYFRRKKGPRVPLPANIGSEAFNSAYLTAIVGLSETQRAAKHARSILPVALLR